MKLFLTLTFAALFVFSGVSCSSTSTSGGGGNPHEYRPRGPGGGTRISAASVDGRFVILEDGSIWNISWSDAKDASRWRSGEAVSVGRSGSSNFPYVLNHERGSSVSARLGKKLD